MSPMSRNGVNFELKHLNIFPGVFRNVYVIIARNSINTC